MSHDVVILGVFMADTTHRADRLPRMGETIRGTSFSLGPGGKGSNQAVAAAKAGRGCGVHLAKLGKDAFADMALKLWAEAGVTPLVTQHELTNPRAPPSSLSTTRRATTRSSSAPAWPKRSRRRSWTRGRRDRAREVFVTQLEQPLDAAQTRAGPRPGGCAMTILNPAPAATSRTRCCALCDYVTPNETEAVGAERHRGDGSVERCRRRPGASSGGALRRPASSRWARRGACGATRRRTSFTFRR
jgi:ribokinase